MRTDISPTAQPATVAQPATLLVSLELSQKEWVVTVLPPDATKMSRHKVQAGATERLLSVLHTHRARVERRSGGPVGIVSIQEAGLDGFWLHRWLVAQSIESHVVDAASIAAPRRKQRAKSDGIDGETLVRTLAAWRRGEPRVCSMVAPPSPAEEDRRRLARERDTLMRERIALSNGIGGRLAGQGVRGYKPLRKDRCQALEALRRPDGSELPPHLMAELRHMLQRLDLVMQQLKAVETARDAMLLAEAADSGSVPALLLRLRGLGPQFTALLWLECFYRNFANRRQVGAFGGLAPTPWRSGGIKREQGISAAGNPRVRKTMIELAWIWLRCQPNSALSRWFQDKVKGASARGKTVLIVALARKLLVALWRYVSAGVLPEGAVLKPAR
jgi:transposase